MLLYRVKSKSPIWHKDRLWAEGEILELDPEQAAIHGEAVELCHVHPNPDLPDWEEEE